MSDRFRGVLRALLTGACASFGRRTTEHRGRVVVTSPLRIAGSSVLHLNSAEGLHVLLVDNGGGGGGGASHFYRRNAFSPSASA